MLLLLLLFLQFQSISAIQLTTTARSRLSAVDLHDFLARPIHWPQIVASSDSVSSGDHDPSLPLRPGKTVKEYFGLGLLSVKWTCKESKTGSLLVMESPDGVPGIARDCSMRFNIQGNEVTLIMGYEPVSPLALLATPVLILDNWIALNVLLPVVVDPTPLASFRKLMGSLYGTAGVLHAIDLYPGNSVLLTTNGIPAFADLPLEGQSYAVLWCAVGPLSCWLTRQKSALLNDSGLIAYGFVECLGALLSGNREGFGSALVVQAVVAAAWIYSLQKETIKST